ncbi:RNA methyltransferase [Aquibacillus sp. 3ASR75-11]|uniref:RNA methyltransferase n=1 Tax=Terrihalobacillus insolitus TaxID=2950438 RepID=A0A9X3WU29_9BACI|nr:RNA methyltransferase [Terrihalobacillus insolitus]MDC3412595.1 RNA methyltransferase [Terrihalobacillus insolitus]MDC3423946.1 RNA methyltransferase [Terrihalobacillus insolitus]
MITSVQNEKVKQWHKLKKRKGRHKANAFLIEGIHLIEEALTSKWKVQELIVQNGVELPSWARETKVSIVADHVLQSITDTKTPQGMAAVVEINKPIWKPFKKLLLIDAVQDPGNLGTMVRTADAAGFDAVILGTGTVDLYNDKVIRSTQGSLFHLPIFHQSLEDVISNLINQSFDVWVSTLDEGAKEYTHLQVPDKIALVMGNEGAGISQEIIELANQKVHIPIYGQAESLNVSVAAGVLMYYLNN